MSMFLYVSKSRRLLLRNDYFIEQLWVALKNKTVSYYIWENIMFYDFFQSPYVKG